MRALLLCVLSSASARNPVCPPRKSAGGPFVILARQRSGSGWLVRLLDGPCIAAEGEVLNHQDKTAIDGALDALAGRAGRPEKTLPRVEALVNRSQDVTAYGFKWMLDQGVREHVDRLPKKVRLVLLRREDLLARLVSSLANKQIHYNHGAHAHSRSEAARVAGSVVLPTGAELLEKLDRAAAENQELEAIVEAARHRCLETMAVRYEELVSSTDKVLERLRAFLLGGEACTDAPTTKKHTYQIHTNRTSDYVENWPAVADTLRGSRWEAFLEGN